ncbi:MAG: hypothetical protein HQL25_06540 [Candidatus Omnitrophica bacterium]|nr:hypothetical protein [Candidatus Omnitrophota bacterium]
MNKILKINESEFYCNIKVLRRIDNPLSITLNYLFIFCCCALSVVSVWVYYFYPSVKIIILFFVLFLFVLFVFEICNEYLGRENLKIKTENGQIFISINSTIMQYDLEKCKFEYHKEKDSWLILKYDNKDVQVWTFAKIPPKEFFDFIAKNK